MYGSRCPYNILRSVAPLMTASETACTSFHRDWSYLHTFLTSLLTHSLTHYCYLPTPYLTLMSQPSTPQTPRASPPERPTLGLASPNPHLLSVFLFQQTPERESDRMDCAICLCALSRIDSDITETRCSHYFHTSCLDEMKSKAKSQCPICRGPLTPPANQPTSFGSNDSTSYLGNFYSQQSSLHAHNPHHSTTQANIVQAARRGREAVQMAIARRERSQLNQREATFTPTSEISSF
jgi:hypothetical protein